MLRGFRWLALAGVVATAALIGPSVALADGCGPATSIYSETCQQPSATGKHHRATSGKPSQPSGGSTGQPYPVPPPTPPAHLSHKTQSALAHAGKDKRLLTNLVSPSFDGSPSLKAERTAAPAGTASLSSTFDLGSGPLILLALLAGSVLSVLGTGGVRAWRGRHRA